MKEKHCGLEDFVYAKFIEHDVIFLSDLIRSIKIDIECPSCVMHLDQLMALRRDFKKELQKKRCSIERGKR